MNLYGLVRMSVKKKMKAELEMSYGSCGIHVSAKVLLVTTPPLSSASSSPQVVMSQRLGSSLRRKVSETETQLLALHEAKLAAISGMCPLTHTPVHPCLHFMSFIYLIYSNSLPLALLNYAINDRSAH